jgi:thiol:disulfide interchange protein DsbG
VKTSHLVTSLVKPLVMSLATALVLALSACSQKDESTPASAATAAPAVASTPAQSYETVAKQGRGFTVGALMSANTVYVMFDPQCPHCGHLWEASVPLHTKVKFVWIPVSFINAKSAPQGAALMSAANPAELMAAHEASILAGTGGTAASASVTPEVEEAIKANTKLFNSLGVDSVPYIVAKNARTGQVVSNTGALATAALADFLGIDQP